MIIHEPLVTKEQAHKITELLCGRKHANKLFPEARKPIITLFNRIKKYFKAED